MNTTELNTLSQTKGNITKAFLSFVDKTILKAIAVLFILSFLSLVVKSQNPIALKSNDMAFATTSISVNPVGKVNTIAESIASESRNENTTMDKHEVTMNKDSIRVLTNSMIKAKTMINSFFQGVDDADDHYKAKKSGKGLILATTLIGGPILGLIPTLIASATTPKYKNLDVPSKFVGNDPYMRGYKSEAHFIKKHNTWPCFVAAGVIWVCVVGFIVH